jgi:hypothetical protein
MLGKQKRLNEVYEHLHNHHGVHTKGGFADSIGYARAYVSSALNGNEDYLTDKLFRNICETYKGVFDINYLLTGKGSLLTTEEQVKSEDIEKAATPPTDEMTANILELYAQRVRLVDDIRATLKAELEEMRSIKAELQQERESLREATYRLTMALDRIINNNNNGNSRFDIAAEQN